MAELEQREGRRALLHEQQPEQRVHLGIEAGIAEAESEAAGHRQGRRRIDVSYAVGVLERRVVGQVEEYGDKGEQVYAESGDDDGPDAADAGHPGREYTEEGATNDLADTDEDTGQADQAFARLAHRFGEADARRVHARVECQHEAGVHEGQGQ